MCNQGTCVNQDRVNPGDAAYSCTCNEGYYIPSQSLACTEQCSADCNVGEYRLNCGGPSHSTSGGSCVSCTWCLSAKRENFNNISHLNMQFVFRSLLEKQLTLSHVSVNGVA